MTNINLNKPRNNGISPVIGVILMVAIVVVLAALIGVYALELGDSTESNVNAGVETDKTAEGIQVRLNSTGNAEEVVVLVNGSELSGAQLTDVGDSVTVGTGADDTVTIVGVGPDGNENTLRTVEPNEDTTGPFGESGVVSGGGGPPSTVHTSAPTCSNISYEDADGDGLLDVSNDYELQCMEPGSSYELVNSIDASGTSQWNSGSGFKPVGSSSSFGGTFNGNDYTIESLTINRPSSDRVGLFGHIQSGATVENVTLRSVSVTGENQVGGLVGENDGSTVTVAKASGNVSGEEDVGVLVGASSSGAIISDSETAGTVTGIVHVGGLVGDNDGFFSASEVRDSSSTATVNGTGTAESIGGLVGRNNSSIVTNSEASGDVTGGNRVGGLIGWSQDEKVANSEASGDVTGSNRVGGLIGWSQNVTVSDSNAVGNVDGIEGSGGLIGYSEGGSVSDSNATGNVSANYAGGGLIGQTEDSLTVSNTFATGDIDVEQSDAGGLIGDNNDSSVTNSYAEGVVVAPRQAGGLIGISTGSSTTVENSYATGNIGSSSEVSEKSGGLVGEFGDGTISKSYSTGDVVNGEDEVGGLVGLAEDGTINQSYSTGDVTGGDEVGGLVGAADEFEINNAYATGTVDGSESVGGLVGLHEGGSKTVTSFATGEVTGNSNTGGLIGENSSFFDTSTTTDSYWDTQSTNQSTGGESNATGLTTSEMQGSSAQTNMAGFDFTNIWNTVNGEYPELSYE